jgi:signal transduction histidine kinase
MVVGNLVDNAGKHAPPGTSIGLVVEQAEGLTRIEVADHGDGVAAVDREHIFAPFTRLDASTTRRVGGVGLGLFLVAGWSGGWAAASGWRTTRAAAPGSWSSCRTCPRCRPDRPGTRRPVGASKRA